MLSKFINTIVCCDCVDGMRQLPDDGITNTVASPPYDNMRDYGGHPFDFKAFAEQLYRITISGGVVVWVVKDAVIKGSETGTSLMQKQYFGSLGFRFHDTIIMAKRGSRSPGNVRYGPPEYAFVFSKEKPRTINLLKDRKNKTAGKMASYTRRRKDGQLESGGSGVVIAPWGVRTSIWEYSVGSHIAKEVFTKEHPARMPEQMAEDHILAWSRPGDLVFDPMAGSGTTLKMALLNNRRYLGFEIHKPYYEIAQRRLHLAHEQHRQELNNFLF